MWSLINCAQEPRGVDKSADRIKHIPSSCTTSTNTLRCARMEPIATSQVNKIPDIASHTRLDDCNTVVAQCNVRSHDFKSALRPLQPRLDPRYAKSSPHACANNQAPSITRVAPVTYPLTAKFSKA